MTAPRTATASPTRTFRVAFEVPEAALLDLGSDLLGGAVLFWLDENGGRWLTDRAGEHRLLVMRDADGPGLPADPPVTVTSAVMAQTMVDLMSGLAPEFFTIGYDTSFRARLISAVAQLVTVTSADASFIDTDLDWDALDAQYLVQLAAFGQVIYE